MGLVFEDTPIQRAEGTSPGPEATGALGGRPAGEAPDRRLDAAAVAAFRELLELLDRWDREETRHER